MGARRLTLLAISVLAVAAAVVSLGRTVHDFYRLDFPVRWAANGLQVGVVPEVSSARAAGLEEGDLVVAVDGVSLEALDDPLFVIATGDEHRLTVLDLAGEVTDLTFRPPPPEIDSVYLTRTLVAVVGLACALLAALSTPRREAATFVLVAVASLLIAAIPHRTAAGEVTLRVLHRSAGAALPFLLVRFFALFPERQLRLRAWDLATAALVAVAGTMAVAPRLEVWWPAAIAGLRVLFVLALALGIGIHVYRWKTATRDARVRRQLEWAALGMFVGLLPYLALVLLPRWLGVAFEPFSWLAVLPVVAVPLGFLAAFREYRLWDLEPIARDSSSATLVLVAGGFIFALTNHLLLTYGAGLGAVRNLLAFATGVLLVVLLQPVRLWAAHLIDQWLHHGRPPPRWLLTHSTLDLVSARDPRELLDRLSQALREGMEVDQVATYLRTAAGSFERVTAVGDEVPEELPADAVSGPFPQPAEGPLEGSGYVLRLPLERSGTTHGLLYVGLRRGVYPLGTERREVVTAFAAQAALALESSRRLDDLQRQAEEYRILHANTQRIIESSAAAILVCDAGGRILSTNTVAAGLLARSREDLVAEQLHELLVLPTGWERQLPLYAVNTEASTRDETARQLLLAVSVLELDTGKFNGRVVVLQDVTELRALQDRVREQEQLAALGRLASGLAHEINTPLTGIASFAQMLGELTPADDPRSQLVRKLVDQSFRVSRIVANLREAVRGSRAGRSVLDLGEVAVRAAQDAARGLAAGDRVQAERPGGAVMVWGEPAPVELAVGNLVRNALEASPPSEAVEVSVVAGPEWGEVRVDDRGPGIPDALGARVFEPFVTTKTGRGGTGLGLAITRDMIVQLGGEVALTPRPDGGTRATIRLPRWEAPARSS